MQFIVLLALLTAVATATAAEHKALTDVDASALVQDTQVMVGTNDQIDLVWWLPNEYWQVVFAQDPNVPAAQSDLILDTIGPYMVIAVVQADISPFGAFRFVDREAIMQGLDVRFIHASGDTTRLSQFVVDDPDLRLLLDQMRPVLAAALGNMGQSFYFFPLPNRDEDGKPIVSPYEKGSLVIRLDSREDAGPSELRIDMPLDSLFVPRICPNGKPAHVSWNYCPWSGESLD